MSQIIAADISASGGFLLIEPGTPIAEAVRAVPQFDKWRSVGADALVTGGVTPAPNGRWKVEFRLWDVATGLLLVTQQYFVGLEEARPVPHLISAAIVEHLGR